MVQPVMGHRAGRVRGPTVREPQREAPPKGEGREGPQPRPRSPQPGGKRPRASALGPRGFCGPRAGPVSSPRAEPGAQGGCWPRVAALCLWAPNPARPRPCPRAPGSAPPRGVSPAPSLQPNPGHPRTGNDCRNSRWSLGTRECTGPGTPSGARRGRMQDSPAQEGQPRRKHVAWSTQAPETWKQVEGSSGDRGLVWLTPDRPLVPVLPERQHGQLAWPQRPTQASGSGAF